MSKSRVFKFCGFAPLTIVALLGKSSEARAEGGAYEECKQILVQDIFNRVSSSTASKSLSSAMKAESFFSATESEAYSQYSKDHEEAKSKGTKIDAEGHYGIAGGEFSLALSSEQRLTESEFKTQYGKARTSYQSSSQSQHLSSQDFVSNYASQVRDPETIRAWRDCVSKHQEMGVYAFASRDKADKVYVNILWVSRPLR